jgi:hypothetical protein
MAENGVPGGLINKTWCAKARVPVVVSEMMKGALRNCTARLAICLECNGNIEPCTCRLAPAASHDSSPDTRRCAHRTLVRMTREKPDRTVGRRGVVQDSMDRFYSLDLLIIPIGARVKIGPGNRDCEGIIPHRWSRWIHVPGVEMMSRSNAREMDMDSSQNARPPASARPWALPLRLRFSSRRASARRKRNKARRRTAPR